MPPAAPSPPTAPPACDGWCPRNSNVWTTKCAWGKCKGCTSCATVEEKCRLNFCESHTRGWPAKCGWDRCSGCPTCKDLQLPPAPPSWPGLRKSCMAAMCWFHTRPWGEKCGWQKCEGCPGCLDGQPVS
ncbi:hypothetical protein EMIHUDRAFT_241955 [Emiliania huxleyi CCMP1516]|uniref:TNFR-Cys domain-containing protein n=2 Tax=Emiliania huxleyi TaxID=2903 RepID=A0A0D3JAX6_EMIH1|nr:hypothetical protein EMIHUDRAFT_241955 [Emiliania huxleyi CCMP1516]EOD20661.1 hypothetical protein EMIHUDRAFT_241955 [Emiliania huxleyi CCMP1516]|eukprot:XP_005773090.1 hypothetical protein EMIHUDRAFT_241955 [Emiliania huxleyi CCMP1516]